MRRKHEELPDPYLSFSKPECSHSWTMPSALRSVFPRVFFDSSSERWRQLRRDFSYLQQPLAWLSCYSEDKNINLSGGKSLPAHQASCPHSVNVLPPSKCQPEQAVGLASNPRAQVDLQSCLVDKLPSLGVSLWILLWMLT